MTVLLAAAVVEGVVVEDEPVVSGVECESDVIEGALLSGDVMSE